MSGPRISIRGTSGSGKSTLGKALAGHYGVPYTELDGIYHQANWVELNTEEFRRRVSLLVAEDGWVIEGNYKKVSDLVLARVDMLIWLDYPLAIVLWRVVTRTVRRGFFRLELWNGNRESIWRNFFTRESLVLWVLQTHGKRRREADAFMSDPAFAHVVRHRFRHPRETAAWFRGLS